MATLGLLDGVADSVSLGAGELLLGVVAGSLGLAVVSQFGYSNAQPVRLIAANDAVTAVETAERIVFNFMLLPLLEFSRFVHASHAWPPKPPCGICLCWLPNLRQWLH